MIIFSAPWVVPIAAPVIMNGSIVVDEGRIIDIGKRDYIVQNYPQSQETSYPCVLMPGLTNAHMHLELSHLHNTIESLPEQNFTDWIESLIAIRLAQPTRRDQIVDAFKTALRDQYESGVVLVGDIGNEYYEELHQPDGYFQPKIVRMLEFLGPNREATQIALQKIALLEDQLAVTGHAPYSTDPILLKTIKQRCNRLQHIFSIHTEESLAEREFIQKGTGSFRDFLEKKNSWDGTFSFSEFEYSGTLEYLDHLDILDEKTLLVHCVHASDTELRLIKKRGAQICLCPGSNEFLGVGLAPVEQMIGVGLLPALGSDSPASNSVIDIWREMQLLSKSHIQLEHSSVLAMAILGGATALRQNADFGSLLVGKKANFIHVSSANLKICSDEKQLMKELVTGGRPSEINWVPAAHE